MGYEWGREDDGSWPWMKPSVKTKGYNLRVLDESIKR